MYNFLRVSITQKNMNDIITADKFLKRHFLTTLESPEPQQCHECQEPQCQYNQHQPPKPPQQIHISQDQIHQIPHIHQVHYTYSRRTSLDSNAIDVSISNRQKHFDQT